MANEETLIRLHSGHIPSGAMLHNTPSFLWFFYRCLKLQSHFFFFLSGIQWNAIPSREMAPGPQTIDRFYDPKSKMQLKVLTWTPPRSCVS